MTLRLQEKYTKEVLPKLKQQLERTSDLAVPRLVKVVVNVGIGKGKDDRTLEERVRATIERITGQRAGLRQAKKSIASFKVRAGQPVGVSVTLRGKRMYDFLDKVIHVALPRVRDFRGIPPHSLDKTGNLTIGFGEQIVFPEIASDAVEKIHGLEVTIASSAKTHDEGFLLFSLLGFPFRKEEGEREKRKKRVGQGTAKK